MEFMVLSCLLSVVTGSFFNVIVSRRDWYVGRSRCDACKTTLKWFELIPIVSFITQGGRCRYCKTKIDKSHITAELFALSGGIVLAFKGVDFVTLVTMLVLLFNAIMDYKTDTVHSLVTYAGCALIIGYKLYYTGFVANYFALLLVTAIVLYFLAKLMRNYMGEGDFDIMFLLILSMGYVGLLYSLFYASAIGVGYAIINKLSGKSKVSFVPFLYFGYLTRLVIQR